LKGTSPHTSYAREARRTATSAETELLSQTLRVGGDQNLHSGLVVVNQGVEALVNQVFHSDLAGDEGLEVNLAGLNQLDGLGVGVHVCDGAADIELLEHNLLNIQGSGLAPNGDDDDLTGGLESIQD